MTLNRDGSRTIKVVDLVSYAEDAVKERIAEQQQAIDDLRAENYRLRVAAGEQFSDARTLKFAKAVHDIMDRYDSGEEEPFEVGDRTDKEEGGNAAR